MATPAKVFAMCLLISLSMQMCYGSAIPIWEFLTRNEKMSYLYSTFAQLVSVHCKATAATTSSPVNQCKHSLLSYGSEKLKTYTNEQLDALDPYQRGASELIWSSIMQGHPSSMLITTRKPLPTPPASSLIIITHQKPTKSTPAEQSSAEVNSHQYPKNPLFDMEDGEHKHKYAMDMDIAYGGDYPSIHSQVETFNHDSRKPTQTTNTYLTGPLVFRLRPDGTPVEEDQNKPLPRDDDLDAFHMTTMNTNPNGSITNSGVSSSGNRINKHRKIATISALKQQHLASLALQQQLQPPLEQSRIRRQFQSVPSPGYFYGIGQA